MCCEHGLVLGASQQWPLSVCAGIVGVLPVTCACDVCIAGWAGAPSTGHARRPGPGRCGLLLCATGPGRRGGPGPWRGWGRRRGWPSTAPPGGRVLQGQRCPGCGVAGQACSCLGCSLRPLCHHNCHLCTCWQDCCAGVGGCGWVGVGRGARFLYRHILSRFLVGCCCCSCSHHRLVMGPWTCRPRLPWRLFQRPCVRRALAAPPAPPSARTSAVAWVCAA